MAEEFSKEDFELARDRIRMELWVSEYKRMRSGPVLADPRAYKHQADYAVAVFDQTFPRRQAPST